MSRFALLFALLLFPVSSIAADGEKPAPVGSSVEGKEFVIGYLEGDWSDREEWNGHPADMGKLPQYVFQSPFDGARMGVSDAQYLGRSMKISYVIERRQAKDTAGLIAAMDDLRTTRGVSVFLIDAQGPVVAQVSAHGAGLDVMVFNISAFDNVLRNQSCQRNLFHVLPSNAMMMDALAQYLVVKKWRNVLILKGPLDEDAKMTASFRRSAKRFGLKIVEERDFLLTQDPRARQKNRVEQITSGDENFYDVIFVADAHGEFSLSVPYRSVLPRPVVGSSGLTPRVWHWAYLRHGAPQVNSRFEKTYQRRMRDKDWAAWMAVKSVSEAVLRTKSTDLKKVTAYLLRQDLKLDGFKGGGYSFRPWDNQLRQPVLLTTSDWVSAVAPLKAFLHQSNALDTLGFDAPESKCSIERNEI